MCDVPAQPHIILLSWRARPKPIHMYVVSVRSSPVLSRVTLRNYYCSAVGEGRARELLRPGSTLDIGGQGPARSGRYSTSTKLCPGPPCQQVLIALALARSLLSLSARL